MSSRKLSPEQREELLAVLKTRFEENMNRHEAIVWAEVQPRLEEGDAGKPWSLQEMERSVSKEALASRLGVSPDTIYHWIRDGELDRERTANVRIHGTTKEQPLVRLGRDEEALLQPLPARPF